jgi:hypothetical protein
MTQYLQNYLKTKVEDDEYRQHIVDLHRKSIKDHDPVSHALAESLLDRLDLNNNKDIRALGFDLPMMFSAY